MEKIFPSLARYIIRDLTEKDAVAIADIEQLCFDLPWTEQQIRASFHQKAFAVKGILLPIHVVKAFPKWMKNFHTGTDLASNFFGNRLVVENVKRSETNFQSTCAIHSRPRGRGFTAQLDQNLLAYLSVYRTIDEVEILNIAVRPEWRQRGFGKTLLAQILQECQKKGIVRAILEVRPSNEAALALYRGLGFVLVGRRRAYYSDTGEDALIYTRDLSKAFTF